jgi:prevent-host-death family protein
MIVSTGGGDVAREKISAAKAREKFSDLVSRVAYAKERHVVTRRGKAVAAMVPIEDLELLEELEDRIDVIEGLRALAEAQERGTKRWEEVKAELGLQEPRRWPTRSRTKSS